jgi:hypothetical protein
MDMGMPARNAQARLKHAKTDGSGRQIQSRMNADQIALQPTQGRAARTSGLSAMPALVGPSNPSAAVLADRANGAR